MKNVTIIKPEIKCNNTRNKVKKQRDRFLNTLTPHDRFIVEQLCRKLMHDYRDVASKRGSRNFEMNRWLKSNLLSKPIKHEE